MLSISSDVTTPNPLSILHVSHSLPDLYPSFSFSSCPSSLNSRCRARWRRTGGRPAPPTPPAARVMSQQPDGKTGSSGCKRSSPPSDEERRHKKDELEGYTCGHYPPKHIKHIKRAIKFSQGVRGTTKESQRHFGSDFEIRFEVTQVDEENMTSPVFRLTAH